MRSAPVSNQPNIGQPNIGQPMPRASTRRLVAGRGRYVDDIPAKGEVYAAFLRSPHAHAAFEVVNISAAAAIPGVVRVLTAENIDPVCPPWKCVLRNAPDLQSPEQRPLARRQAVFQGEPIALVVAQSRAIAEDALELIEVEWSERPAAISLEAAAMPDAVPAHENLKSNICWRFEHRSGDPDKAFADAEHVVLRRLVFARKTGVPLEPRGILASYDPSTNGLIVHVSHQMPHQFQLHLAELLGMSPLDVRVICSDIGGAFGIKMHIYPEEVAVCAASRILGRPVKFIADRVESLSSDVHAREHIVEARMAVNTSGMITAIDVDDIQGLGAYSVYPRSSTAEAMSALRAVGGPYRFDNYHALLRSVLQNKVMTGQYRSVGHPVAAAITEALVEDAAAVRGEDSIVFRQRNFLPTEAMPWVSPMGARMIDLSHHACLERMLTLVDYPRLRQEIDTWRQEGRIVGLGLASFVEFTATGAEAYGRAHVPVSSLDGVMLTMEPTGEVRAQCSASEIGQGIQQGLAQIIADAVGVRADKVRVALGDTAASPHGGGAWSSRGAAITGEVAWTAGRKLRNELLNVAAAMLQTTATSLDLRDGRILAADTGAERIAIGDVARTVIFHPYDLPAGTNAQMSVSHTWGRDADPFLPTNGVQASLVEIDPISGLVRPLRHWVVEDCGRIINPLLVDEQIRGGVVQGIGEALYEICRYTEDGQYGSGTLADYLLPMAADMPDIVVAHVETPYSGSQLGAKGAGEAGTCGAPAAVLNAVNDALRPFGGRIDAMPISPVDVLRALGKLPAKAGA
ncbi:MAG: xanthine dehydrogenase family protein molybdopterin-binding subunit [Bradyrhizobium sp.]|nr:xanthine dehydrogenase family protein molybdopterin-binding subunit [Bradyrhizobium sp.]